MSVGPALCHASTKLVGRPVNVAEVDEINAIAEVPDGVRNVDPHRREVTLTERNPVEFAVYDIEHAVIRLDAGDNTRHTADIVDRGVVGVKAESDSRLLRDGNDPFEEVFEVFPEVLGGRRAGGGGRRSATHLVVIIGRGERVAARGHGRRSACPPEAGHPVVTYDLDAEFAEVSEQGTESFDLVVAAVQCEASGIGERDAPLENRWLEAVVSIAVRQTEEVVVLVETMSVTEFERVKDRVLDADLFRKTPAVVGFGRQHERNIHFGADHASNSVQSDLVIIVL
jgi:hypothetical protein